MKMGNISELEMSERFTYLKNIPFDSAALRSDGAKFQVVTFLPGGSVRPHHHEKTCEIFFVYGGSGEISMNGKPHACARGDFFLCEPGDIHSFKNTGKEDFVILIFKTNEAENDIFWDG
ncbi:MAG: cupin domain-containing protein [Candidatus Micrarchaeota archaeon]|nr:cupin domain-containing protein [Candidatus Micrarchaeota archaeon]